MCHKILHTRALADAALRAFLLTINRLEDWYGFCFSGKAIERKDWQMRIICRARCVVFGFVSSITAPRLALAASLVPVTLVTGSPSAYAGTPGNVGSGRQVQRPGRLGEG